MTDPNSIDFEERADFLEPEALQEETAKSEFFSSILQKLYQRGTKPIIGPRGCGKTHLMRFAHISCLDDKKWPQKVIKALGFHRSCIDDWLSRYEQGGEQALSTGKITGRPRKFPDEYAERLRELVKTNPLQLDFHDALWTRSMIQI